MFKSIEIEHFRGISHAKIDGLKEVNIFCGKNNCGKSSLLDAIFLISGLSNPKLPININLLRNYLRFEPSDLALDFYTLDTSRANAERALAYIKKAAKTPLYAFDCSGLIIHWLRDILGCYLNSGREVS